MMRVAGVEISASAARKLAYLLCEHGEEALASHLCHAIEHLEGHFPLVGRERRVVLRVLTVCPPELADVRNALLGKPEVSPGK
jgi:hypothetical protein